MAPLEIPQELEDSISKFSTVDVRDNQILQCYNEVAELIYKYTNNALSYANFPRDTREFSERVNKALKTLDIYLEMTAYNDAFAQCARQWKDTMEQVADSIAELMTSLDELRIKAAGTSKPVTAKESKEKALTLTTILSGTNRIGKDELVTIIGEAFGKPGFVRVDTTTGDRAVVPLINLKSTAENTELLTFFMSSVEKMKQCIEQTRKEVTAKFWALARSYFQSRSKQDFVTLVDSKSWKLATDMLLKMEDNNSTGFSFRSCINGILANAVGRSVRGSFEIGTEETNGLHEFISSHQWVVQLLTQSANHLASMEKIWGEDWQKSLLRIASLKHQVSAMDGKQSMQQSFAGQAISEYQHTQVVQHHTSTSRRFVTSSNSYEMTVNSLSEQQQHQGVKDADIYRVPSRRSSIASDAGKQQQQQRGSTAGSMPNITPPLPSPIVMSARMETREPRRTVIDDFSYYENRSREASALTDSVSILSEEELHEQRMQLQGPKRLLIKMEKAKAPTADTGSQTATDSTDFAAPEQKSVRLSLNSSQQKSKSDVIDSGCYGDLIIENSSASIDKASEDRLVVCRIDIPIIRETQASKEVAVKQSSLEFKEPKKPLTTTGIYISPGQNPVVDSGASLVVIQRESSAVIQETPKPKATTGIAIIPEKIPIVESASSLTLNWRESSIVVQETPKPRATTGIAIIPEKVPIVDCSASLAFSSLESSVVFREKPTPRATSGVSIGKQMRQGQVNIQVKLSNSSAIFRQESPKLASTSVNKTIEQATQLASAKVDYRLGSCRATVAMVKNVGIKIQPESVTNTMKSLGKPIVDNGVFRINELIDSWTDMQGNKPRESGAHYTLSRRDARTQKNAARPPQVECGVGANLDSGARPDFERPVEAASVQTAQFGRTIECGADGLADKAVANGDKQRKTRGTDMSERHTICDTGVCASTKQIVKIQKEELELRRQQRSAPPLPPKPLKPGAPASANKQLVESGASGQSAEASLTVTARVEPQSRRQPETAPPTAQSAPLNATRETMMQKIPPTQPHPRTKSVQDVPDKEWRFPISRQDFRKDPKEQPLAMQKRPTSRLRQFSLPRQRKQQQQQQQQQPQQAAGMDNMQTRVEPWAADSRQHWSSRSMHVGTRPASNDQKQIRSQLV